jgi:hypothetical protein
LPELAGAVKLGSTAYRDLGGIVVWLEPLLLLAATSFLYILDDKCYTTKSKLNRRVEPEPNTIARYLT